MKKIHNYMMLFMLAFVAVCCSEEEPLTNPVKKGGEVQFGLSLERLSRTVYGDEANNAFPIYWVNGDKVQIFSPQCLDGRRNAEYQVAVTSETQNFADNLTKTGAYGIQWGNVDKAIFYSLYPSGSYSLSEDGTKAQNITINYSQSIIVDGESVKSDMEDCLMYAKNDGGQDNDYQGVPNGETVNLQYDPISTVFWIKLNVPSTSADDFTIQSVSLEAPAGTNIAGTFSLNIEDGTFGEWGESKSNVVSAQIYDKATGGFYTLTKGNSVEIPLFLAPVTGLNTDGWKIKVVANQMEKVKTLTSQDIVAGKIHKVTLPNLSTSAAATEWDVATWMKYIPRNVYLSEVSIPGSWNSVNSDFQTNTTISQQYAVGVRAFHLDTRWRTSSSSSFLGATSGDINGLSVAGANSSSKYNLTGQMVVLNKTGILFEDYLKELIGNIKPNEYMVLVCSFAQDSYEYNGTNGWIKEITTICEKDEYKDYILNAQNITSNTVVGDALGKIVVLIAASEEISSTTTPSSTLAENSSCFFSYLPMELSQSQFVGGENNNADGADNEDKLWYTTTITNDSGITLYNCHAQMTSSTGSAITNHDRGYVPSHTQRENVLKKIVDWSKDNYGKDDYAHDKWIYLGLGGGEVSRGGSQGITSGSYATIASTYNTWINGKVAEMGTTPEGQTSVVPYYPVGIVLMNYVNNYASTAVKNILLLNNKYRLQYDPSKPSDYDPNYKDPGDYDGSGGEGGDNIL